MPSLEVTVTSYEDVLTPQGESVTMYMVQVRAERGQFLLAKRYSDFASLHLQVKDLLPFEFKFPNKSVFNNAAQFTKERRQKGFDEMLRLLSRCDPLPEELRAFLDLGARLADVNDDTTNSNKSNNNNNNNNNNGNARTAGDSASAAVSVSARERERDSEAERESGAAADEALVRRRLVQLSNHLLRFRAARHSEAEVDVDLEVHRVFPAMLRSSLRIAAILYALLIVLGVVDVSSTSYVRMLWTLAALVALGCFVQIRDAKKSMLRSS